MYRLLFLISITTMGFSNFALAASVPAVTQDQLVQLERRAEKAATSTAGEYAQIYLDAAKTSIADGKISIAAEKEKMAARYVALADEQLIFADVKGAEKELLEKLAVRRSEIKKMQIRLDRFQQGEEN